ncbi:transcription initiation factor TFIIA large subunit [Clonorchis sinensis]|uniref:Transcription initiation factor TFIIA large subunit n=1 Tax=Clonorchis sinensis TaxID=79923 RepID=G7YDB6_CLOSI|nr:transcription initiation factor TFIIA large subunit [Clonorchis sinensis]
MTDVSRFYHDVIDDVINGVKDEWVEEGLDLQVLDELRKLWTTKLAETHVFDPEPTTNTAAQYLNLIQRSQLQVTPTKKMSDLGSVRHTKCFQSIVQTIFESASATVCLPGSLATLRPTVARPVTERPQLHPTIQSSTQVQRMQPQHTTIMHGNLVGNVPGVVGVSAPAGAQVHMQPPRAGVPTAIQSGTAPQIAALPSGLTGHLVQIGQQTYLVPQTLVGLRQPTGTSQLSIPHFVGAPGPTATTLATSVATDHSSFPQTQVDGGHDSEESKYCDTPSSHHPTPGAVGQHSGQPGTDRSVHPSDLEDDDDEDDDDFVAATPGFTPSSVRSHYPPHSRDIISASGPRRESMNTGTTMNSGPSTPATPLSVAPRTPFDGTPGWRRPGRNTPGDRSSATPAHKRRRRSSYQGADTDTEVDDYEEDEDGSDVGEEVELMTNVTMTPAAHGGELEEDDDGHAIKPRRRAKRSVANARQAQSDANRLASDNLLSPGSLLGDAPPEPPEPVGDSSLPHGDEDEEEEEEDDEPLNSEDDVSDEEPEVLFESDNVVVCQYDKIHRSRNRWRFHLKDGIMAINGRDHVFQKAVGEAEW